MRILIVSVPFPPLLAMGAFRVHSFARYWADQGHQVTVLTTAKPPAERSFRPDVRNIEMIEVPAVGEAVWARCRDWLRRSPRGAKQPVPAPAGGRRAGLLKNLIEWGKRTGILGTVRMPDPTDLWVRPAVEALRRAAGGRPFDLMLSSSGPYTAHLVARRLRRSGAARRWIADFRDLWTANPIYKGLAPFCSIERRLERGVLRSADAVTTVSEPLADWLRARARGEVVVIYNGHDRQRPAGDAEPRAPLILHYTGSLYPSVQDPEPLLGALRLLAGRGQLTLRFEVAGDASPWRARLASDEVQWLIAPGWLDPAELQRRQDSATALVTIDTVHPGVIGGKLPEYLASVPPILVVGGGGRGAMTQLVEATGRGVHAGDTPEAVAATLRRLMDAPASLAPEPDLAAVARFSRRAQAGVLDQLAHRLLASRG